MTPREGKILVFNYLTRQAALCSTDVLYWVTTLSDWQTVKSLKRSHPHIDTASLRSELRKLVELAILVLDGSSEHQRESSYENEWEWGLTTGAYHFSLLNNVFETSEAAVARQLQRQFVDPSPRLYRVHQGGGVNLPLPGNSPVRPLLRTMLDRRSNRVAGAESISLEALSDCLFAGMAITGTVETPTGTLPLQMTPSGGARNAYEAFVMAYRVDGLSPGVYHYSATEHSLALVSTTLPERPSALLSNQYWADDMPAIVFLIAYLERLMWKYSDPNGYRVALIEAGHKGQNIALAAAARGLTACPTAALQEDLVKSFLQVERMTQTPVYALCLSEPGQYDFTISSVNPAAASIYEASEQFPSLN
jgi:SagB-type dehydrogenase family enzyme